MGPADRHEKGTGVDRLDVVADPGFDREQVARVNLVGIGSDADGEAARERVDGDRTGGAMRVELRRGRHRDEHDPKLVGLDERRGPPSGGVFAEDRLESQRDGDWLCFTLDRVVVREVVVVGE